MNFRTAAAVFALLASSAQAATSDAYDYTDIEQWKLMAGSQCNGMKNSPVAVTSKECTKYADYALNHGDCTFADMDASVGVNGVKLGFSADNDCTKPTVTVPDIDEVYIYAQHHIHLSSEHTLNDEFFSAELHMVHLNAAGTRAAVVGTFIEPSRVSDNPIFESYLNAFKAGRREVECNACWIEKNKDSDRAANSDDHHPYKLLESNTFYHYDGGLTTPPCSEIVWWNLADTPMSISVRQFAELSDIILNTMVLENGVCKKITVANKGGSTSRDVQPLYGRTIDKICPSAMNPGVVSIQQGDNESAASAAVVGVTGAITLAAAMASQVF